MAAKPDNRARYGTRRIEITDFQIYNGDGKLTSLFEIGESMRVRIDYRVNDPTLDERPTFMVGFHRDGLQCTHRIWTEGFHVSAEENASGHMEAVASPLLLGPGRYTTTVMIVEEGHLTTPGFKPYFTISKHLYDMHARAQYIEVSPRDSGNPLYYDFVFQHPSRWICNGIETSPSLFIGDKVVLDDHIYVAAPSERQERKKAAG
jgi:hypothetical protein